MLSVVDHDHAARKDLNKQVLRFNTSTGGTPRGQHHRSPVGGRRAQSAGAAQKRVSFDEGSAQNNDRKAKVCYYCGIEGHIAKDCTNEKSTREKKLPWMCAHHFTKLIETVYMEFCSHLTFLFQEFKFLYFIED